MGKNKFIKTGLYFFFVVLFLTSAGVVLYTAIGSDRNPSARTSEQAEERQAADGAKTLQPVSSTPHQERADKKLPDPDSASDPKEVQQASAPEQTTYLLTVTDGCLQVYLAQTGILYMETAIEYDLLPENVQAQIDAGKYFDSEEALLEFLENYSS